MRERALQVWPGGSWLAAVGAIAAIRNVVELVARHYRVGCVSSTPRPNPWGSKALVLRLEKLR